MRTEADGIELVGEDMIKKRTYAENIFYSSAVDDFIYSTGTDV